MADAKYCDRCGALHRRYPMLFELTQVLREDADLCEACQRDLVGFLSNSQPVPEQQPVKEQKPAVDERQSSKDEQPSKKGYQKVKVNRRSKAK
jgi:hypothetical protein